MSDSRRGADRPADQQAFSSTDQPTNQHPTASSKSNLAQIFAIMPRTLELSFCIHISSVPQIRIHDRCIQHVALTIRQNDSFGKHADRRLPRDSPRLVNFCHPTLHRRSDRNHCLATQRDRLCYPPRKRIPSFVRKVVRLFSSFTFRAVPAGKVCATATEANNIIVIITLFIVPPEVFSANLANQPSEFPCDPAS